jgi:DNA-binding NtrC family response regulator
METKVLLVDGDEEVLNSLRHYFRKSFPLVTASTVKEGLRLLKGGEYMVVVADYMMPKMDGILFLRFAQEGAPDTTRILLCGSADTKDATEALNQGHIFRFLTKPCTPEDLGQAIQAGIEYYRYPTAEKGYKFKRQSQSGFINDGSQRYSC